MLTEEEKEITLRMLEKDLRQYVTQKEWEEYIPKLLNNYKFVPSKYEKEPDAYINRHFVWNNSLEGDSYWRSWSEKVFNRVYYGTSSLIF
jgi:hypothetical protein